MLRSSHGDVMISEYIMANGGPGRRLSTLRSRQNRALSVSSVYSGAGVSEAKRSPPEVGEDAAAFGGGRTWGCDWRTVHTLWAKNVSRSLAVVVAGSRNVENK